MTIGPRRCPTIVDGKECGLEFIAVEDNREEILRVRDCPLGHRTYLLPLEQPDKPKPPPDGHT
jgi:hypothetical protein